MKASTSQSSKDVTMNSNSNACICSLDNLKVISSHCQEMLQYIAQFPYSEYHVKRVILFPYEQFFYIDCIEDHIKNSLERGYAWETHIAKLIMQYARPGSKVLDVGAHIGTHSLTMAKCVGENGEVLAFEPQPKIFRELFLNMKLNKINNASCYWVAVGDENGTIETSNFAPLNEGGTPLIIPNLSMNNWSYNPLGGTGIFVDLITIDSLNLENVSLIKIDVEGMENAVLDGARETILRNKPIIIIEIMGGYIPETAPRKIVEQIEFTKLKVQNLGYKLIRVVGWDYLAIPK